MRLLTVQRNVASTQAKGTLFCLHVGGTALHFFNGSNPMPGFRLELFTPLHRFRWSTGAIYPLGRYGWPVETFKGRPILNAIRLLLHTRRIARWEPPAWINQSVKGVCRAP